MNKSFLFCLFLLTPFLSFSQSFYDEAVIQSIEITFAQSNWDALLDAEKAGNDGYIMALSVSINGTVFDSVGVKYKGNSTYNANQTKNPFHIELDTYKEQDYQGYKDIKLSNGDKDPSFIREALSYKILRNYMDAPLANFSHVYVNSSYLGLYTNVEAITKTFVSDRFGSKSNAFFKCNPPAGAGPGTSTYPNLVYLGTDSSQYYSRYELKSEGGWNELIDFCDTLQNEIASIENILDVDRALWMLAFDNVLVNLDSYIGSFAQNYYLYRDDYGRFLPVVWDLNESFGRFSMTGTGSLNTTLAKQQMSHLLNQSSSSFPLVSKLLSVPKYKKIYLAHFKTLLLENFGSNGPYIQAAQSLRTTIDAAVQADPNKFFTYADFINNLNSDITSGGGGPGGRASTPGITNLMNARYSYLTALSDFTATEPSISNISLSSPNPLLNEILSVTAEVINEESVFLRYRTAIQGPFTEVQMFDDGLHNDGSANDNIYGAELTINSTQTSYYIYAENSSIAKFSPTNAEHEFYTIFASSETVGDLVINEFMASNDNAVADQDGEYDDWIELYNKGTEALDIGNYHLSDDGDELDKFTFPSGTIIQANEYITVWADEDSSQAGYHADFKISAGGEGLYLSDGALGILDSLIFSDQETDVSFGRYPNGTGAFQTMPHSFGSENMLTTGIFSFEEGEESLRLYPNPASSSFTLELGETAFEESEIKVFDVNAQLIYKGTMLQSTQINSSNWTAGIYVVIVGTYSKKLIKY
ncbi:MAG: CotH kinase family protein [Bacteroidia bacterium]|nr:CotH kinase family protein [Bacteroidia bacterium]